MKSSTLIPIIAFVLPFGGCSAGSHHGEPAGEPQGESSVAHPVAGFDGPKARAVELPDSAGDGPEREVKVLVDEPALKLATIVLRKGATLPEHHSPVAVTIQVLRGAGTATAGDETFRIDPTHAVVLAPAVPHAVQPDAETDLVLLVHHHGRGQESHP
jgi:quercetin dioxygenase-like cupin family protein